MQTFCSDSIERYSLLPSLFFNQGDSTCLYIRPFYNGILSDKFDKNWLPTATIPLDTLIVPTTHDGGHALCKYWAEHGILPFIWDSINEFYEVWQVPLSKSAFHREFPSNDTEDVEGLIKCVGFSTAKDATRALDLNDLRVTLEMYCTGDRDDIWLNVLFETGLASCIRRDLMHSPTLKAYLLD